MSDVYTPAATVEEDFVNLVRLELNDIKNTFYKIGFRLKEARNLCYYKKLGFDTIEGCAEALFGFKKTTTYDLIGIAEKFYDRKCPMQLAEPYQKFNQSQLVILSQVRFNPSGFFRLVRPEDSIEKLKKAKKYWNGICIQGSRTESKTIDEFIEKCDAYEAKRSSLSDKDFKKLDSIINNKVQTSGKNSSEADYIQKNSGYPEKSNEGPIVLDVPAEDVLEVPEEIIVLSKELKAKIVNSVAKDLDLMSYKTIFDPDDKGLGVRVQSDQLVRFVLSKFFEAVDREKMRVSLLNEWNKK